MKMSKAREEAIRAMARAEVDEKFDAIIKTYEEIIEGYKELSETVKAMQGIYNELDKLCVADAKS